MTTTNDPDAERAFLDALRDKGWYISEEESGEEEEGIAFYRIIGKNDEKDETKEARGDTRVNALKALLVTINAS